MILTSVWETIVWSLMTSYISSMNLAPGHTHCCVVHERRRLNCHDSPSCEQGSAALRCIVSKEQTRVENHLGCAWGVWKLRKDCKRTTLLRRSIVNAYVLEQGIGHGSITDGYSTTFKPGRAPRDVHILDGCTTKVGCTTNIDSSSVIVGCTPDMIWSHALWYVWFWGVQNFGQHTFQTSISW